MDKVNMNFDKPRMKEKDSFAVQGEEFIRLCDKNGEVFIYHQNELPEEGEFALCFWDTNFWIACFKTKKAAIEKARDLGLTLL
jgi:hypothetical protein